VNPLQLLPHLIRHPHRARREHRHLRPHIILGAHHTDIAPLAIGTAEGGEVAHRDAPGGRGADVTWRHRQRGDGAAKECGLEHLAIAGQGGVLAGWEQEPAPVALVDAHDGGAAHKGGGAAHLGLQGGGRHGGREPLERAPGWLLSSLQACAGRLEEAIGDAAAACGCWFSVLKWVVVVRMPGVWTQPQNFNSDQSSPCLALALS